MDVLDRQYGAFQEIGEQRFRQIKSMVVNWAKGTKEAGVLEKIFYIALQQQEPATKQIQADSIMPFYHSLDSVYQRVREVRERQVHQAGLPLVQDKHLQDAGGVVEESVILEDIQAMHEEADPVGI